MKTIKDENEARASKIYADCYKIKSKEVQEKEHKQSVASAYHGKDYIKFYGNKDRLLRAYKALSDSGLGAAINWNESTALLRDCAVEFNEDDKPYDTYTIDGITKPITDPDTVQVLKAQDDAWRNVGQECNEKDPDIRWQVANNIQNNIKKEMEQMGVDPAIHEHLDETEPGRENNEAH